MPHELGAFYSFGQQGIPDGRRRPREYDPRDAKWAANPLAPFVDLCGVGGCHRPEPFKSRAQMLQLAALAKAPHQGLAFDCYDGFQYPCNPDLIPRPG
jgi:hypothetical protein